MAGNRGGLERRVALLCVHMRPSNVTHCGAGHGFHPAGANGFPEVEEGVGDSTRVLSRTIAMAVGIAVGYIAFVVLVVGWCAYKRRKGLEKLAIATDGAQTTLVPATENGSALGERQAGTPIYRYSPRSGVSSSKQSTALDRMAFPRDAIQLNQVHKLGTGVFGEVMMAPVVMDGIAQAALIKTLVVKEETVHQLFRDEMDLFFKTDHPHVARLIGLCRDREPILALYQYLPLNLKRYLVFSRPGRGEPGPQKPPLLTIPQIIHIAYQVAQGMEHISDLRFTHKDLAARNVLLDESLSAKVGSLSLQTEFVSEYYVYRQTTLPLRWMPAEALLDDEWSMKSDVWSFGCLLWELLSSGELPYCHASNDDVIEGLKAGSLHLALPPGAAGMEGASKSVLAALAALLSSCWAPDPRQRPTFTHLRDSIGTLHLETNC